MYTVGKDEMIPVASVLTRVSLHKVTTKSWRMPINQYKGVMKILLDDGEFEGDATDEKDESVSGKFISCKGNSEPYLMWCRIFRGTSGRGRLRGSRGDAKEAWPSFPKDPDKVEERRRR
jgi:hypothetical protein